MIVRLSTYIKSILLLKGGQYFCPEKKYVPPFIIKIVFISKRRTVFVYVHPFTNKNVLLLKGWQCLRKYAPPFIKY